MMQAAVVQCAFAGRHGLYKSMNWSMLHSGLRGQRAITYVLLLLQTHMLRLTPNTAAASNCAGLCRCMTSARHPAKHFAEHLCANSLCTDHSPMGTAAASAQQWKMLPAGLSAVHR
jgi:hypothetical protein